jgi:hypothetical protein
MFGNSELNGKAAIWLSELPFGEQKGATCSLNKPLGKWTCIRLWGTGLACHVNKTHGRGVTHMKHGYIYKPRRIELQCSSRGLGTIVA